MSHTTCTQGNWGNSWLLVVGNQITNLTLSFSSGHNLCFKCPNGSYKLILDIYVPRYFQHKSSILWVLIPVIALWKFDSLPGLQLPKWELPWKCEGSFLHTFLHSWEHEMWLPSFLLSPHPCKPFALVASPMLGSRHQKSIIFLEFIQNIYDDFH
jgi:hypothetical protein